jgi:hypothetical protein
VVRDELFGVGPHALERGRRGAGAAS